MKTILGTLIICVIVVYVYLDYDNIKARYFGGGNPKPEVKIEQKKEIKEAPKENNTEEARKTKFKKEEIVYINAMAGDLMAWQQTNVPAWATYDGSPYERNQRVKTYFEHRDEVKIISVEIGRGGKAWYYVRLPEGFPIAGWVEEKYLSKEDPPRRSTRPTHY